MTRGHTFLAPVQRAMLAAGNARPEPTGRIGPHMNFDFSDDQKFLKNEARKFLAAECTTARVRKVLDDDGRA